MVNKVALLGVSFTFACRKQLKWLLLDPIKLFSGGDIRGCHVQTNEQRDKPSWAYCRLSQIYRSAQQSV